MELYVKQKCLSFGDKFTVYDAQGNEKYSVQGEVFTIGRKFHIYDTCGREVAFIKQELFCLMPRYTIYIDGNEVAEISKKFALFHMEFGIDGIGWQVDGDFFDHKYYISDGRYIVASVSKQWFTLGDAYNISISSHADEITALAVCIVIDACIEDSNNN